jgi:hypothetical protein
MAEAARLDDLADTLPVEAADVGGDNVNLAADDSVNGGAPPESEPLPSTPSSDDLDAFDKFLAEYDQNNGAGNGAAVDPAGFSPDELARLLGEDPDAAARQRHEQEWAAQQQQTADQQARSAMALAQRDRELGELRGTVEQLQRAAAETQWREHQARAFQDFKSITAEAQARIAADIPDVEDDYVETRLLAEAARDLELTRAFDARYYSEPNPLQRAELERAIVMRGEDMARAALQIRDPVQRRLAEQHIHAEMRRLYQNTFPDVQEYRANGAAYLRKAIDKIDRQARRPRIDPVVSGDVLAVAQAVRGASSKVDVREPAPNWGELSDAALNAFTKRLGFRAI